MAAISLHLEPNSDLNRQPGPCSLYCTRAFRTGQHVCRSRSSGAGCVAFLESPFALRNLHASHALRLHMCSGTFAARWLQHGFQLTSFLLVPEYKLARVGRRLGTALLSSLSFCSFIFHSSCQESIFFQKFLLCSPCPPRLSFSFFLFFSPLCNPTVSFLEPLAVSYTADFFHLYTFISDFKILGQQ